MFDTVVHRWLRVPYRLHAQMMSRGKRPTATVLLIHGIGNSGKAWDEVTARLPHNMRVVAIDLLGFGRSARPTWVTYDAKTQARAVLRTYFGLGITGRVIIVGHSMGALVAVDMARRYPLLVKSLILCSPPFYQLDDAEKRLLPRSDKVLRDIYRLVKKHPEQFISVAALAKKYKLTAKAFDVTPDNITSYMGALEASIVNQTAFNDARALKLPIHIIHGTVDPVVVARNLRRLAAHQPNITVQHIAAGHEIRGLFVPAVVAAVKRAVS